MRMTCDVSVLIATYDRKDLVAEAVDSVLGQTLPPAEILVLDHGSRDGTVASLQSRFGSRIEVVSLRHEGGRGDVVNAGIARSRSTWIALLDDDDLWREAKLERQVAALEASGSLWSVTGFDIETTNPDGTVTVRTSRPDLAGKDAHEEILAYRCAAILPSMLIRRSTLTAIGNLNGSLLHDDLDLALRLARSGSPAVCPESLVRVRKGPRPWGPEESSRHHREMLAVLALEAGRPARQNTRELLRRNGAAHWKAVAAAEWHAGRRGSAARCLTRSVASRLIGL